MWPCQLLLWPTIRGPGRAYGSTLRRRAVEERDRHAVTPQIRRSPEAGSHSAFTAPAVVMPMYVAGIVEAIGTTASIDSPVNLTVSTMARSSVRLDPARYGVPGSDTRPSSPRSHSTSPTV